MTVSLEVIDDMAQKSEKCRRPQTLDSADHDPLWAAVGKDRLNSSE